MLGSPCSPCCSGCDKCADGRPKKLVITVTNPEDGGVTLAAGQEGDVEWSDVETTCRPVAASIGVGFVNLLDQGSGYTSAPTPALSHGNAVLENYVIRPLQSVTVTNGGSGYTSQPDVYLYSQPESGSQLAAASLSAVVKGAVTGIAVSLKGSGYLSAPRVVVGGGGGGLDATATMDGYLYELTIDDGGSGYTSTPTVVLTPGAGSGAEAQAAISGGAVTSISVTDGGEGYTTAPSVVLSGGGGGGAAAQATIVDGKVSSVSIIDGGSGYTSAPSVSFATGGGNGKASVFIQGGTVRFISILQEGTGYLSPPTVSFTGGGGSGAKASAKVRFKVASIAVTNGGSNYPLGANLILTGGGGSGASGQVSISGAVTEVLVNEGGSYYSARRSDGVAFPEWPAVSFFGGAGSGAEATPNFAAGPLDGITVQNVGSGYTEAPTVSFSGGGGSGAVATTTLTWAPEQVITRPIPNCSTFAQAYAVCSETESEQYPPAPCVGSCDGYPPTTGAAGSLYGEFYRWWVLAATSTGGGSISWFWTGEYGDGLYPGEAIFVYLLRRWSTAPTFEQVEEVWLKRYYSRVTPTGDFELESQPDSATNVILSPSMSQKEDLIGQPYWVIDGISLVSGGSNLLVYGNPTVTAQAVPRPGHNYASAGFSITATASYSPPVVSSFTIRNAFFTPVSFSVIPTFSYVFSPTGVIDGEYVLSQITVVSGGTTSASNGTYKLSDVALSAGYGVQSPTVDLTVVNGTVQSAAIVGGGLFKGGATLTSATLVGEHAVIGRSGYETSVAYSEPTVTATAPGGTGAEFSISLTEQSDVNENPYWVVSGITVVSGGSGYTEPVALDFAAAAPNGIESIAAVAIASLAPREQPTLSIDGDGELSISYTQSDDTWSISAVSVIDGGTTYQNEQYLSVVLGTDDDSESAAVIQAFTRLDEPVVTASASGGEGAVLSVTLSAVTGGWTVSSVAVENGGAGYSEWDYVGFSGGDQPYSSAYGTITTDENGAITSVSVWDGGLFYDDSGEIESVVISEGGAYFKQPKEIGSVSLTSGGRYYNKVITETSEPLPQVDCLGDVNEENGWTRLVYKPRVPEYDPPAVGDAYSQGYQVNCNPYTPSFMLEFDRTRRCPLPEVTLRIEE